jgi:hypothetical protein
MAAWWMLDFQNIQQEEDIDILLKDCRMTLNDKAKMGQHGGLTLCWRKMMSMLTLLIGIA